MHLITMAHLGEAQGVIELFKLKRVSAHLFEGENLTCLITGEGPFEAAAMSAGLLGKGLFESVINLGIAGSLSQDYKIGEIYPIRSSYLAIDGKVQFKSFKSSDSGLDCITSMERILSPQKALPLLGVAHLVDREAWGVAMGAKAMGVEFKSFKLISDQAGSLGACEVVRDMASEWSQRLAIFLNGLLNIKKDKIPEIYHEGFHFTFSTSTQYQQMLKKICLREDLTEEEAIRELPLEKIRNIDILPKERVRLLLNSMQSRLDPLKERLENALGEWKRPFEERGLIIQTDSSWESSEVKIILPAKNQRDLEEKIMFLSKLKLEKFYQLRNGNIHVE